VPGSPVAQSSALLTRRSASGLLPGPPRNNQFTNHALHQDSCPGHQETTNSRITLCIRTPARATKKQPIHESRSASGLLPGPPRNNQFTNHALHQDSCPGHQETTNSRITLCIRTPARATKKQPIHESRSASGLLPGPPRNNQFTNHALHQDSCPGHQETTNSRITLCIRTPARATKKQPIHESRSASGLLPGPPRNNQFTNHALHQDSCPGHQETTNSRITLCIRTPARATKKQPIHESRSASGLLPGPPRNNQFTNHALHQDSCPGHQETTNSRITLCIRTPARATKKQPIHESRSASGLLPGPPRNNQFTNHALHQDSCPGHQETTNSRITLCIRTPARATKKQPIHESRSASGLLPGPPRNNQFTNHALHQDSCPGHQETTNSRITLCIRTPARATKKQPIHESRSASGLLPGPPRNNQFTNHALHQDSCPGHQETTNSRITLCIRTPARATKKQPIPESLSASGLLPGPPRNNQFTNHALHQDSCPGHQETRNISYWLCIRTPARATKKPEISAIGSASGLLPGPPDNLLLQPSSLNRVSDSRNKGLHTIRLIVTTINAMTTVASNRSWNWP